MAIKYCAKTKLGTQILSRSNLNLFQLATELNYLLLNHLKMKVVEVLVFIATGTQFQHPFATEPKQFAKTAEHECPEQASCSTSSITFWGINIMEVFFRSHLSYYLILSSTFRAIRDLFLQRFRGSCLHCDSSMLCITHSVHNLQPSTCILTPTSISFISASWEQRCLCEGILLLVSFCVYLKWFALPSCRFPGTKRENTLLLGISTPFWLITSITQTSFLGRPFVAVKSQLLSFLEHFKPYTHATIQLSRCYNVLAINVQ